MKKEKQVPLTISITEVLKLQSEVSSLNQEVLDKNVLIETLTSKIGELEKQIDSFKHKKPPRRNHVSPMSA